MDKKVVNFFPKNKISHLAKYARRHDPRPHERNQLLWQHLQSQSFGQKFRAICLEQNERQHHGFQRLGSYRSQDYGAKSEIEWNLDGDQGRFDRVLFEAVGEKVIAKRGLAEIWQMVMNAKKK